MGIAFFVSKLVSLYMIYLPLERSGAESRNETLDLGWIFLFFVSPPMLVAISSYFHVVWRSYIALLVLILISGIISFYVAIYALITGLFSVHPLIGTLPMFIGFATMIVAVANTIYFIREDHPSVEAEINDRLKRGYRLQLFFGTAALTAYSAIGVYLLFTDEFAKKNIIPIVIFGLICPFLAAFGSFLQTIKQNDYGVLVIFPAFIVALFLEIVSGRLFKIVEGIIKLNFGIITNDYYHDTPYILVLITTILALNSLRLKYRFF